MATQVEIDECYEAAIELAKRAGAVSKCPGRLSEGNRQRACICGSFEETIKRD